MSTSSVSTTIGQFPVQVPCVGSDNAVRPKQCTARVVHVINGEHYSGAERVQDLLACRLPDEGFEVAMACVKPDRFASQRMSQNTPLFDLSMRSKIDLRAAWKLARLVRREDFQIIHAHTPRTAMIGRIAASLCKVPMVYHVHSPTSRDSTRRFANWLNTVTEKWSVRSVARLIAVSSSLGKYLIQRGYPQNLVTVVPNGVPIAHSSFAQPQPTQPDTTQPDLTLGSSDLPLQLRSVPASQWTLGTVALFRPRKGTEILLDALALLHQKHSLDVVLHAVGPFESDQYETALKQRAARLGIDQLVRWTGFTRNVNAELARMDLFVLPSLFGEGLPMVVLEAMAAGVPVVGTNVEGVPEAIRDGQDGVIAEPGNAADLARSILRIVQGGVNFDALRRNALRRQAEQFSDRSMAAGVARVYREVLGSPR